MGSWVIGHNIAGYLPESDTYAFGDWDSAAVAITDDMRAYADTDDEQARDYLAATAVRADYPNFESSGYGDDEPCMRGVVDSILTDDGPGARRERAWQAWAEDSDGRRIVFWLAWSDDREPEDDDS